MNEDKGKDPRAPNLKVLIARLFVQGLLGRDLHTETPPSRAALSLFIRHVDGGSSYVVEQELLSLTTPTYDVEQYGIRFVASPRHADVLLLTGPLTWNMRGPTLAAFRAMPLPRCVVTVGDCADYRDGALPDTCPLAASYAVAPLPEEMRKAIACHVPGMPPAIEAIIEALQSLRSICSRRPHMV